MPGYQVSWQLAHVIGRGVNSCAKCVRNFLASRARKRRELEQRRPRGAGLKSYLIRGVGKTELLFPGNGSTAA
jgi:hypothetical protein